MIKIFVACHKPTYVLDNKLLYPIQVGAALAKERLPGMLPDDDGDNISSKNRIYCELTAQYWAWRNCEAEYYGFFHYRRYLSFAEAYEVDPRGKLRTKKNICPYIELDDIREDLSAYKLQESMMEEVIRNYDMITVLRERINVSVYKQYCQYHDPRPLDTVLHILNEKYPQYQKAVQTYMDSRDIYYMNMFIMKRSLYMEYASWLFDILETYERSEAFPQNEYEVNRLMGYLAERLFGVFYTYQREHGITCAELPYLKFYNTDLEQTSHTVGNIRVFQLKPTKLKIKIDMRKVNKMFPAGSKRRILLRNIFLR